MRVDRVLRGLRCQERYRRPEMVTIVNDQAGRVGGRMSPPFGVSTHAIYKAPYMEGERAEGPDWAGGR
jgi:hypothetical protein